MKEIIITFKAGSEATYEVPDYKIAEFFRNAYPLIFDRIEDIEMRTIPPKEMLLRRQLWNQKKNGKTQKTILIIKYLIQVGLKVKKGKKTNEKSKK